MKKLPPEFWIIAVVFILVAVIGAGQVLQGYKEAQERYDGPTVYKVRGFVDGGCQVYAVLACSTCSWQGQRFFVICPGYEPVDLERE